MTVKSQNHPLKTSMSHKILEKHPSTKFSPIWSQKLNVIQIQ